MEHSREVWFAPQWGSRNYQRMKEDRDSHTAYSTKYKRRGGGGITSFYNAFYSRLLLKIIFHLSATLSPHILGNTYITFNLKSLSPTFPPLCHRPQQCFIYPNHRGRNVADHQQYPYRAKTSHRATHKVQTHIPTRHDLSKDTEPSSPINPALGLERKCR